MFQFFPDRDGCHGKGRPIKPGVINRPIAALPLEIQRVEKALRLDPIFEYVEGKIKDLKRKRENDDDEYKDIKTKWDSNGNHMNDLAGTDEERRTNRKRLYNMESLCESRTWMKDLLLSDTVLSDDDEVDEGSSDMKRKDEYVRRLLKEHVQARRCCRKFQKMPLMDQEKFMYYGSGLVLNRDNFTNTADLLTLSASVTMPTSRPDRTRRPPKTSEVKEKHRLPKACQRLKVSMQYNRRGRFRGIPIGDATSKLFKEEEFDQSDDDFPPSNRSTPLTKRQQQLYNNALINNNNNSDSSKSAADSKPKAKPKKTGNPEQMVAKRKKVWTTISKKDIPRMHKHKSTVRKDNVAGLRKVAKECQRECRRMALASQKQSKEACMKARRLAKEMQAYWRRFEKVEKEHRKKAEKEALEQKKMDMEVKEMLRQQRKLNFLIAQTELYAHFMAGKLSGGSTGSTQDVGEGRCEEILRRFDEDKSPNHHLINKKFNRKIDDDYDSQQMKDLAMNNVKSAIEAQRSRVKEFDASLKLPPSMNSSIEAAMGSAFSDPTINKVGDWKQPNIFRGTLKSYQLKGMNWIANLYDQGINGILADEMGLGKTVQSVAFLAHLAEEQGIWGPFLVVAPASTLHNWLQEMTKFVPDFKVIPYWGTTNDRKVLRKFWSKGINKNDLPTKDSSFHVVITSYQMIVQDAKYFQQINWHYMVLDEAQAIKSSNSSRWKSLLVFKCRNRLLLTGTPIQNSMAELWALLHFIMPTLFDSHEEFSEWFAKDIENHVERQSSLDTNQLSRLHMILKPFMLRRVKKDVENELSEKIEVQVCCPLTRRQRLLYKAIKNKISIDDLLQSSSLSVSVTNSLMNIVMQLRKVCNHPELFERRDLKSPCFVKLEPYYLPKLIYREGWMESLSPGRQHLLTGMMNIFDHHSIHSSIFHGDDRTQSNFSFTRFTDLSVAELCTIHKCGCSRWLHYLNSLKSKQLTHHQRHFRNIPKIRESYTRFLLDVSCPASPQAIGSSDVLKELCFVRTLGDVYGLCDHKVHFMNETFEHRKMRLRHTSYKNDFSSSSSNGISPNQVSSSSPTVDEDLYPDSHLKSTNDQGSYHGYNKSSIIPSTRGSYTRHLMPTSAPSFLLCVTPKVICQGSTDRYTCDRSAEWARRREFDPAHNRIAIDCLNYGSSEVKVNLEDRKNEFGFSKFPVVGGFIGSAPVPMGYTGISLPNKEMLVTDAGKLTILDELLTKLKSENHRVLIYSQMTKMIDILEEFLWHRRHTYMRLDGSSKISERRDMVADFQARSDIFIFLLSTRAGGLGINLTAADTVIFYDSDWNPTVDQQAMDRAHRLGQTKQVTVYRLICEGTIEERILQRAKEKSEIQRMVISGGEFAPDILKPKEVVTLLLDDEEMARRVCQKQEQRRARDELRRDLGVVDARKRSKSKTGRGPGRPPKRSYMENRDFIMNSLTFHSPGRDLVLSYPSSPVSEKVVLNNSRMLQSDATDDDDISSSLILSDISPRMSDVQIEVPRKRGRPKGSTSSNPSNPPSSNSGLVQPRPRGRGSIQKSLNAAEAAALTAAKQAALVAHGYNYSAKKPSPPSTPTT